MLEIYLFTPNPVRDEEKRMLMCQVLFELDTRLCVSNIIVDKLSWYTVESCTPYLRFQEVVDPQDLE